MYNRLEHQSQTDELFEYVLNIDHTMQLGNISQLWDLGNTHRAKRNLPRLNLDIYLSSPETIELIHDLERTTGTELPKSLDLPNKSSVIITHEGNIWAHICILVDAASKIDPAFKLRAYTAFLVDELE